MKTDTVKKYLLIGIIIIASVLRLWNLNTNPPSLTPDEAALGYNAYSILKTGRDEYGTFMPIIFKSFGDYKPGFYIYTTVPFVAIFGLNEWSVRLPSAVAGILSVWLLYLIIKQFSLNKKLEIGKWKLETLAAFLLAISPWHIYFSRGGWEINLALTLSLTGIYFFLKSFSKPLFLILSSLSFSLTYITYQGAKLSTTVILLLLFILYFKDVQTLLKKDWKKITISIFFGLIILLPIFNSFYQGQTGRLTVFSVLSYRRPEKMLQGLLDEGKETIGSMQYYLFHSESLNFARGILGRWFNHFSGRFLFFEGDWENPKQTTPYHGVLTVFDIILFIFGIISFAKAKKNRMLFFFGIWLLLAPLPSALSRDQVHAVRAYNMVIPLTVLLALGLSFILQYIQFIKSNISKFILYASFFILYSLSYVYFLDMYFIHLPVHNTKVWDYGYKQIVEDVFPIQNNYAKIRVQQSYAQPYIFFLFYEKYDPASYQKKAAYVEGEYKDDVGKIEHLDNLCFCPIDWSVNRGDTDTLFVADELHMPVSDSDDPNLFNVIDTIKYPDGFNAFRVVEVKK
jgi:4-amino-4-deoxy-L-arabinose transferase-like glycosyltransferase